MPDLGKRCVFCGSRSGPQDCCSRCLKKAHFASGRVNHRGETAQEVVLRLARNRAATLRAGGGLIDG